MPSVSPKQASITLVGVLAQMGNKLAVKLSQFVWRSRPHSSWSSCLRVEVFLRLGEEEVSQPISGSYFFCFRERSFWSASSGPIYQIICEWKLLIMVALRPSLFYTLKCGFLYFHLLMLDNGFVCSFPSVDGNSVFTTDFRSLACQWHVNRTVCVFDKPEYQVVLRVR